MVKSLNTLDKNGISPPKGEKKMTKTNYAIASHIQDVHITVLIIFKVIDLQQYL